MGLWRLAPVAVAVFAQLPASVAHSSEFGDQLGALVASRKRPASGLYAAGGAGWQLVDRLSLHGELGYARGVETSDIFTSTAAWHLAISPRLLVLDGRESLSVAVVAGWSTRGLLSFGLAAGAEVDVAGLDGDRRVGPVAHARFGVVSACVFARAGVGVDGDRPWLVLGLELFRLPPGR